MRDAAADRLDLSIVILTYNRRDCLRELLDGLLARRAEWWAAGRGSADPVAAACLALEQLLGVREADPVAEDLLDSPAFLADCREYLALVARNGAAGLKGDVERAGDRAGHAVEHAAVKYDPTTLRHTVECNLDALRILGLHPAVEQRRLVMTPGAAAENRIAELLAAY